MAILFEVLASTALMNRFSSVSCCTKSYVCCSFDCSHDLFQSMVRKLFMILHEGAVAVR